MSNFVRPTIKNNNDSHVIHNAFQRLPNEVIIHSIAGYVANCDLLAVASTDKELLATLTKVLEQRKQSLHQCKEIKKIYKQLRNIIRLQWNPIDDPSLSEDEYDVYLNDFLLQAKQHQTITVAFIESVEDLGWGQQLTSSDHKERVAKSINALRIHERANFENPQVLNQLGLVAMPRSYYSHAFFPFSLPCFTAAYLLDRSFLRAKRNLIEGYKKLKTSMVEMMEEDDGLFLGVPFKAIAKEMRVVLNLKKYDIQYVPDEHGGGKLVSVELEDQS